MKAKCSCSLDGDFLSPDVVIKSVSFILVGLGDFEGSLKILRFRGLTGDVDDGVAICIFLFEFSDYISFLAFSM